ncbi:MAG: prolipoprotein diacylglyceryl transferase [Eubacteriales bacterium]|nr:prolipoprotein diacylglyceryl transferase [Eubacteriales bacterium]
MIDFLILRCWEKGWSGAVYRGSIVIALLAQAVSLLIYAKAFGFSRRRAVTLFILIYPFLFFWMYFITWVEFGFTSWGTKFMLRVYMWIPLIFIPYSKLLKIPYGRLCDYFAPGLALSSLFGHIACPFSGCCYGYPCSWGIYNPVLRERLFPIQWIECAASLAIFIFLVIYLRKNGYDCRGRALALFLVLFGAARFIGQFFRDNTKLFLGISELAVCAFFTFAAGAAMLLIIRRCSSQTE